VLDIIEDEQLCQRADALGERLRVVLRDCQAWCAELAEVRGLGSMIAAEFCDAQTGEPSAAAAQKVQKLALEQGLLLLTCGQYGNVIRFLYPLTIPDAQFEAALRIIESVMKQ
ncbi:aminotransferase class III-fold pyridoxal phosphate-dependent enzyme, partial [Rahnella perminowiae]